MTPTVAIIEPHHELAVALQEVVSLARCTPVMMGDFDELSRLGSLPAAIVVRVAASRSLGSPCAPLKTMMASTRPKVFALTSNDEDVAEAERLGCDVVLREPQQVRALYDVLVGVAGIAADQP